MVPLAQEMSRINGTYIRHFADAALHASLAELAMTSVM